MSNDKAAAHQLRPLSRTIEGFAYGAAAGFTGAISAATLSRGIRSSLQAVHRSPLTLGRASLFTCLQVGAYEQMLFRAQQRYNNNTPTPVLANKGMLAGLLAAMSFVVNDFLHARHLGLSTALVVCVPVTAAVVQSGFVLPAYMHIVRLKKTACREIGTDLLGTDLAATSVCSIVSAVPLCLAHSVLTGAKRWFTPRAYGLCALQVGAFYAVAFGTIDALEKLHQ